MERVFVATNGLTVAYRAWGDAASPLMVLLHATGETSASWELIAPALAETFRVVAVDLRGHGGSDWPGTYTLTAMRDDVLGVLRDLGAPVTLVGHSLGGVVAYLVAESQPAHLVRLVIEDACPPYPRNSPVPARPADPLPFDWDLVAPIRAELNDPSRRYWPALRAIDAPTLIMGGGPDSPLPQELLTEVAEQIPTCQLTTINAGHMIHDNAPQAFLHTVLEWTATHPTDQTA